MSRRAAGASNHDVFGLGFMMPHHDLEDSGWMVAVFGLRSWLPLAYHTIGCFVASGRLVMALIRQRNRRGNSWTFFPMYRVTDGHRCNRLGQSRYLPGTGHSRRSFSVGHRSYHGAGLSVEVQRQGFKNSERMLQLVRNWKKNSFESHVGKEGAVIFGLLLVCRSVSAPPLPRITNFQIPSLTTGKLSPTLMTETLKLSVADVSDLAL
jgi:hypothetical protein